MLLELVEAHLDDELRLERASPRARRCPSGSARRSAGRSSRRPAAAPSPRSRPGSSRRPRPSRRSRPRRPRVEAEQQRRDRLAAALLPAHAGDDAVRRPVRLDLDDAVARPGQVREPELLGDHAVEACGLQRLQPLASLLDVVGDRRQRNCRRRSSRARRGASRSGARAPACPSTAAGRTRRTSPVFRPRACGRGSRPDAGASASRRSRARRLAGSRSRRRAPSAAASARRAAAAPGSSAAAAARCATRERARRRRLEHAAEAVPLRLVAPAAAGRKLCRRARPPSAGRGRLGRGRRPSLRGT